MNNYKTNIDLTKMFVKDEKPLYDGSFIEINDVKRGRTALFFPPNKAAKIIPELYDEIYRGMALKIFLPDPKLHLRTQIQRIYSWYGLAPKVYKIISVEDGVITYKAQVVEDAKGDYCFDILEMRSLAGIMAKIDLQYHIYNNNDFWPSNMIAGRWIDFSEHDFRSLDQYIADAAIKYNRFAKWGNGVNSAYQQFPALGIVSGRDDTREKMFDLDSLDFENKTVLDIGSSGGYFTNYCDKRGARAVGVDLEEVVQGAKEASNAANYNSEFYPFNFSKGHFIETIRRITGIEKFDYMFFLSMDQHIGFREEFFKELVKDILFFESNGGKPVEEEFNEFDKKLKDIFSSVEFKGVSAEGAKRNLFVCKKHSGTG